MVTQHMVTLIYWTISPRCMEQVDGNCKIPGGARWDAMTMKPDAGSYILNDRTNVWTINRIHDLHPACIITLVDIHIINDCYTVRIMDRSRSCASNQTGPLTWSRNPRHLLAVLHVLRGSRHSLPVRIGEDQWSEDCKITNNSYNQHGYTWVALLPEVTCKAWLDCALFPQETATVWWKIICCDSAPTNVTFVSLTKSWIAGLYMSNGIPCHTQPPKKQ